MKDKIYSDFTEYVLPKVGEGVEITKDYFIDLFGRYITYLLITDTMATVLFTAITALGVYLMFFKYREPIIENTGGGAFVFAIFLLFPLTGAIIGFTNIVKDIYIPEVRIYEQLKYIK